MMRQPCRTSKVLERSGEFKTESLNDVFVCSQIKMSGTMLNWMLELTQAIINRTAASALPRIIGRGGKFGAERLD